jgi:hypothetical protein
MGNYGFDIPDFYVFLFFGWKDDLTRMSSGWTCSPVSREYFPKYALHECHHKAIISRGIETLFPYGTAPIQFNLSQDGRIP